MISFIVAADENNVIGKNNQLPWHLPGDMKYFKNQTWGMTVIMGRKSLESLGKPLQGRKKYCCYEKQELENGRSGGCTFNR